MGLGPVTVGRGQLRRIQPDQVRILFQQHPEAVQAGMGLGAALLPVVAVLRQLIRVHFPVADDDHPVF